VDNFDKEISKKVKKYLDNNVSFSNTEKENIQREIERHDQTPRKFNPTYWTILVSAAALLIILSISFFNNPSGEQAMSGEVGELSEKYLAELEKVDMAIKEHTQLAEGEIQYVIEITNDSQFPIKQGTLFLSYDIKLTNGVKGNPFKMIFDLPKEIAVGDSTKIETIIPASIFDRNKVTTESLTLELKGYLKEISDETMFNIAKSDTVIE